MFLKSARAVCSGCREPLPRAAFHRCPLCHEPIRRASEITGMACRRCNRSIPRGHIGACPSCRRAAPSQARGSLR